MAQTATGLSQYVLNGALGPLLLGSWFNTALFSFEVPQLYRYLVTYPIFHSRSAKHVRVGATEYRSDPAWIRILILWMFSLDTISSFIACAMAYTYIITRWGNISLLQSNNWMMAFLCTANGLSTLTMHLFLISRYRTLSRAVIASLILCLLALAAAGLYVFISISLVTLFRRLADRPRMKMLVTTWALGTATTDWLIAGALMWCLFRVRTSADDSKGTVRMVTRLIRISGLSGAAPAILAILTFIAYISAQEANWGFMFSLSCGRAATLTVLYNLNSRDGLACDGRRSSVAVPTAYLATTLEPKHMFRGAVQSCSTIPADHECALDSLGQVSQAGVEDASQLDSLCGPDFKLVLSIKTSPEDRSQRVRVVRMALPARVSPTPEGV